MNEWMNEVNIFVSKHISVPLIYFVSECIYNALQFSAEMNMSVREKTTPFIYFDYMCWWSIYRLILMQLIAQ